MNRLNKSIVHLLGDPGIDSSLINKILISLSLSNKQLTTILDAFEKNRRNISSRTSDYAVFENEYVRFYMLMKHKQYVSKKIEKGLFLSCVQGCKRYPNLTSTLIKICDTQQLVYILDSGFPLKKAYLFVIARRALVLNDRLLYEKTLLKINDKKIHSTLDILSRYYSNEGLTISEIEIYFHSASEKYFVDYLKHVPSYLDLVPESKNFLDARYKVDKRAKLVNLIIERLKKNQPFSLLRLSDGESYGFSQCPDLSNRQENHWWGSTLPEALRKKIKSEFVDSIKGRIDVFGMPTPYKFVNYLGHDNNRSIKLDKNLDRFVVNRLAYTSNQLVRKITNGDIKIDYLTEDQINLFLFNRVSFQDILKAASRVIVITGYIESYVRQSIDHANLIVKSIPTHNLNKSNSGACVSSKPLPYVYDEINHWINDNVGNGDLCLISAGFIGKIFVMKSFQQGAVALDV